VPFPVNHNFHCYQKNVSPLFHSQPAAGFCLGLLPPLPEARGKNLCVLLAGLAMSFAPDAGAVILWSDWMRRW